MARAKKKRTGGRSGTRAKAVRRQELLEAARDVFARVGYAQATIDDVVERAGVARGTFYLYFEDKRAVFAELVDRFSARLTMTILPIDTGDPARPVAGQVRENILRIIRACLNDRETAKVLLEGGPGTDPVGDRKLHTFFDELLLYLTDSLREGQRLGIVAEGEPRVLAHLTIGAMKELMYQAVTLGLSEESAEALADQVFDLLGAGYLRVDEPGPRGPAKKRSRSKRKR